MRRRVGGVAVLLVLAVACGGSKPSSQRAWCNAVGDVMVAVSQSNNAKFEDAMHRVKTLSAASDLDGEQRANATLAILGWEHSEPRQDYFDFATSNGGGLLLDVSKWCEAKGLQD